MSRNPRHATETADHYVIDLIDWQFWGTLTSKIEQPESWWGNRFFALIREIAHTYKLDFQRLLWVLRLESGDRLGRMHSHFLLGGLNRRLANLSACSRIRNTWHQLGGGIPRVVQYQRGRGAASYLLKNLGENAGQSGFSGNDGQLTIANSVWREASRRTSTR